MGFSDFAIIQNKDHATFPGPGQYTPRSDFDKQKPGGRAAALRGRIDTKPSLIGTNDHVGPGRYELKSSIGEAPGGKFVFSGPHQGLTSSETNLGPKYDQQQFDMASNPATPRFTFGSKPTPREALSSRNQSPTKVLAPEPPLEQPPRHKIKGPSFGGRPTIAGPYDVQPLGPGPAGYDVPRFGDRLPKPKPPAAPHVDHEGLPRTVGPGPAAYDPPQYTIADTTKPKFESHRAHGTMSGRNFLPEPKSIAPGPGHYDDPTTLSARAKSGKAGVSILTRPPEYHDMDDIYPRPAPGDYAIPSTFETKSKGFTFGARRPPGKPTTDVPAPGHVDLEPYGFATQAVKGGKGIKFNANASFEDGVKKTAPRETKRPDDDTSVKRGPKGGSSPTRSPTKAALPALPSYDAVKTKAPAFTMSGRHKPQEVDATGPGPGSYDAAKYEPKGRAACFFRGPYSGRNDATIAPGPGAYDATTAFEATRTKQVKSFAPPSQQTTPRSSPR